MLAKITSCALVGLEGITVEVEVDISPSLPSLTIVGLPNAAVQEARERVRATTRNSGFNFSFFCTCFPSHTEAGTQHSRFRK